jgi:GDSL-like Lipase/Acylhydrolase family
LTGPVPPARRLRVRILAIVVAAILVEAIARLGLLALGTRGLRYEPIAESLSAADRRALEEVLAGRSRYLDYHRELGWALRPGGERRPLYHANAEGFRAEREYPAQPPAGTVRVAAFGDSFTHGDEVPFRETWAARLERHGLEVLNFGVGGYGLDQALLRYRMEGKRYHPRIVLIGYMSEDLERSVNVYRPFSHPGSQAPLAKPRFRLDHDTLVLVPNPVPTAAGYRRLLDSSTVALARLGADDYFYRTQEHASAWDVLGAVRLGKLALRVLRQADGPIVRGTYNPRSEAFRVTVATFAAFVREVRADGAKPMIVIFPTRFDIQRYWRNRTRSYDALRTVLDSAGLPYVDMVEAFEACRHLEPSVLAPHHYSTLGNARVAAYLGSRLEDGLLRSQPSAHEPPTCAVDDVVRR